MTAERDSMTLNEVSVPALGVEERSDEAPRELLSKVGDGGFQAARSISFSPSLNLTPSTISARR